MKDIIFAAMVVCLSSAAIGMLSPDGKGGLKKQISFACAVAVCASLLVPVIKIVGQDIITIDRSFPDISVDSKEAEIKIALMAAENICREMEKQVSERYNITSPHLVLELDLSDLSSIKILSGRLSGDGELDKAAEYIENILGCSIVKDGGESYG